VTVENSKLQGNDAILSEAKRQLQSGNRVEAVRALHSILDSDPTHKDALYYLAVSMRQQGDSVAARNTLQSLFAAHPDYGRAYQEEAYNLIALKRNDSALEAFERAVALNPALLASWKALHGRYGQLGLADRKAEAANHVRWLEGMPSELQTVTSLLYEGKLYVAEQICRQFLQKKPHHQEGMRLLAEIGSQLQIFDDAEYLLESCVEFYPEYERARLDYVQVLHKRQKFDKALNQALHLRARSPENMVYDVTLAAQQQAVGDFSGALSVYDKVLSEHGEMARILTSRGHALKTSGRADEAVESYQRAYRAQPDYGDAYWSLANLKTYRFSESELAQMVEQEASLSIITENRFHLCFALGKAYEDLGDYARSFAYYDKGNALKRAESGYRSEIVEQELKAQKALFDGDFFEERSGFGHANEAPIFILGLPRAGSTLLEQILASHSLVDGTMELANIIGTANRLNGQKRQTGTSPYPKVLAQLSEAQTRQLGEQFIQETEHHRGDGIYFIDKMPNNFRHIPLIQLILPKAKIIDARRHPMACCFSGFKQLFAEGQEFTYGLDEIGRYYRAYVDVMAHWERELPGRILRVQHEDVVEDLESQVRRILDYCGLPFEQACLDFHETERAVRTPSAEQVRQPIYKSGMEQWQHFGAYLGPLEDALGPTLSDYR
jgi:tetratricopeptide (TPR) repeat protein